MSAMSATSATSAAFAAVITDYTPVLFQWFPFSTKAASETISDLFYFIHGKLLLHYARNREKKDSQSILGGESPQAIHSELSAGRPRRSAGSALPIPQKFIPFILDDVLYVLRAKAAAPLDVIRISKPTNGRYFRVEEYKDAVCIYKHKEVRKFLDVWTIISLRCRDIPA